jgi:MFS family permease
MALGLYDAAFATLTALFGREARGPITGITLIAGFASTVGWPLSALLNDNFGWRSACLGWAAQPRRLPAGQSVPGSAAGSPVGQRRRGGGNSPSGERDDGAGFRLWRRRFCY